MFISCEKVKLLMVDKGAQFIDVRTPPEFMSSPLPGAVNIPLQLIGGVAETKLDKSKPVVLFCQSGARSGMAMQVLHSLGFDEVYNMGSYLAWE